MDKLKDILWPIVAFGGMGAFIDFLIGKTGQEKAKNWLLTWWVRFDDVRWSNFGRVEALFACRVIDKWFGRRAWSFRRVAAAVALSLFMSFIGHLKGNHPLCLNCGEPGWEAVEVLIDFIGFCMAISFTRIMAYLISYYLTDSGTANNLVTFIFMVVVNYLALVYWWPCLNTIKDFVFFSLVLFPHTHGIGDWWGTVAGGIETPYFQDISLFPPNILKDLWFQNEWTVDSFALLSLSTLPMIFRFIISLIFVGSFLVRPLMMRPVNLVWRRIVESEKPVFTLIFGGAAAVATAISEAVKHL
jgi:hypothetical protein